MLVDGRARDANQELLRLGLLGSDDAAALMACMVLRGVTFGLEPEETTIERCRAAAHRGNSYAQFVMAESCRGGKRSKEMLEWLRLSAEKNFAPAIGELGVLASHVPGQIDAAARIFKRAIRMNHIPSMLYFLSICIRGKLGLMRKVTSILCFPFLLGFASITIWYDPFKVSVFSFQRGSKKLLFDNV